MNDTNITRSPLMEPRFLKFFTIYVHTFLVAVGVIGNIFSIFVFLRSVRNAPKILTRNSLILLTTSNSMYLVLVWCYNVAPRLQYLNTMVPNRYSCKFIIYLINLAVSVNALITVGIISISFLHYTIKKKIKIIFLVFIFFGACTRNKLPT